MATTYVVLWEHVHGNEPDSATDYIVIDSNVEATNAEQARRRVAESDGFPPALQEELGGEGVTLIAVPARNWRVGRGTLKAETTLRIRST